MAASDPGRAQFAFLPVRGARLTKLGAAAIWRLVSSWFLVFAVAIAVFGAWEWLVGAFGIPEILLPRPSQILRVFLKHMVDGTYWRHGLTTVYELGVGFLCGTVLGVVVAAVMVHVPLVERSLYPYVVLLQTFPKIAVAPLLITWFGFGVAPKAVLGGMLAFFPVLVNMMVGLRAVEPEQVELLESLSANKMTIFRLVRLPASLPYFFAAMETGVVLAMLGAITGEFVGARRGLGYLLVQQNAVMAIDGVFGVLIVFGLLGVGLHMAIRWVHKRVVFWQR